MGVTYGSVNHTYGNAWVGYDGREINSNSTEIVKNRIFNFIDPANSLPSRIRTNIEQEEGYLLRAVYPNGEDSPVEKEVSSISGATLALTTFSATVDFFAFKIGKTYTNNDPYYHERWRLDGSGDFETQIPNTPSALAGKALAGGLIRLTWDYYTADQETPPAFYNIEYDSGGGYVSGGTSTGRQWTSGAFSDGTAVDFRVNADDGNGNVSDWVETTVTADAEAAGDVELLRIRRNG